MRRAGVLLHVTSLPGPGPCGTMGAQARRFVDFLRDAGQSVWQMLPLTPPACFHSPYAAHSVFAGNPLLIDLEELEEQGLLPPGSVAGLSASAPGRANLDVCEEEVMPLLRRAFEADFPARGEEIARFREEHAFWLEDYAHYMALRTKQGDISYLDWPQLLSMREPSEMARSRRQLERHIDFWVYLQYLFFTQWRALRAYANERGVSILGDMPIYTAEGSADVWSHGEVFQLDERRRPRAVAGVPPDAFSATGQLWGSPLYDWDYLRESGYRWWVERMRVAFLLYDEVRIDHFRALDEYYAVPAGNRTAEGGTWEKGPGMDFFQHLEKALPQCQLIAEDLGILTDGVRRLLRDTGLPGMKVLLFAFEPGVESDYLPHNHTPNSVAYIGTHDNDTAVGWLNDGNPDAVRRAAEYLYLNREEGYHWGFVRGLYASVAETAIVQMQDFLGLDNRARMNIPATVGRNWEWRMQESDLSGELAEKVRAYTRRYSRCLEK